MVPIYVPVYLVKYYNNSISSNSNNSNSNNSTNGGGFSTKLIGICFKNM